MWFGIFVFLYLWHGNCLRKPGLPHTSHTRLPHPIYFLINLSKEDGITAVIQFSAEQFLTAGATVKLCFVILGVFSVCLLAAAKTRIGQL